MIPTMTMRPISNQRWRVSKARREDVSGKSPCFMQRSFSFRSFAVGNRFLWATRRGEVKMLEIETIEHHRGEHQTFLPKLTAGLFRFFGRYPRDLVLLTRHRLWGFGQGTRCR